MTNQAVLLRCILLSVLRYCSYWVSILFCITVRVKHKYKLSYLLMVQWCELKTLCCKGSLYIVLTHNDCDVDLLYLVWIACVYVCVCSCFWVPEKQCVWESVAWSNSMKDQKGSKSQWFYFCHKSISSFYRCLVYFAVICIPLTKVSIFTALCIYYHTLQKSCS